MNKDDMIYDIVKRLEDKLIHLDDKIDKHINASRSRGSKSAKELAIIAGIITTICTALTTTIVTIFTR